MKSRKKVSITLSANLLAQVDRYGQETGQTRSRVIEDWSKRGAHARAALELRDSVVEYYTSLSQSERADEAKLSAGLSRATKRVKVDEKGDRRR